LLRSAFAEGGSTEAMVDASLRRFREDAAA
jgi:hypothetical protein